jgi:hypothetical protein
VKQDISCKTIHVIAVQKDVMLVHQPIRVKNAILDITNIKITITFCVTNAPLVAQFVQQLMRAYNVTMGISDIMIHVQNVRRDARIAHR